METTIQEQDIEFQYRIRRLTPTECGRLMNFTEPDIQKMLSVNSNSAVYKQCGNSIVVSCLMALFSQLNIKGVSPWNQMSDDDKYKLIYGKEHFHSECIEVKK